MIKALILRTYEVEIRDALGGDEILRGEDRVGIYPTVDITFYNSETEQDYGTVPLSLRSRSTYDTIDAIKNKVHAEFERVATEQYQEADTFDEIDLAIDDWGATL